MTIEKEVIDGVAPFFREKPKDIALSEGEPLELTCLVASDPKPAIQWLKNDLVFCDDSRLTVKNDDSGRSTLILDPAMPSDVGLYKVRRIAISTNLFFFFFSKVKSWIPIRKKWTRFYIHFLIFLKIVARNQLGQSVASARVVLGDIPDSPDSPLVEAMTDTDVLLSWKTPSRLNHSAVLCYKVQMGYIDTDIDWVFAIISLKIK